MMNLSTTALSFMVKPAISAGSLAFAPLVCDTSRNTKQLVNHFMENLNGCPLVFIVHLATNIIYETAFYVFSRVICCSSPKEVSLGFTAVLLAVGGYFIGTKKSAPNENVGVFLPFILPVGLAACEGWAQVVLRLYKLQKA